MIKETIAKVIRGESLSEKESEMAMGEILDGKATSAQIGSFITAREVQSVIWFYYMQGQR